MDAQKTRPKTVQKYNKFHFERFPGNSALVLESFTSWNPFISFRSGLLNIPLFILNPSWKQTKKLLRTVGSKNLELNENLAVLPKTMGRDRDMYLIFIAFKVVSVLMRCCAQVSHLIFHSPPFPLSPLHFFWSQAMLSSFKHKNR